MKTKMPKEQISSHVDSRMVTIPAGVIQLRDDRKKTSWSVEIESFQLAKFPVTQELYFAVTGTNPSVFKGDARPVENVSWFDAVRFCNLLSEKAGLRACYAIHDEGADFDPTAEGYRLPTEAEWEFACRAGTQGATYGDPREIAWFNQNSEGQTHEVGLKQPNAWGLSDMLGNVWEWCSDLYDEEVYGTYRLFRGGGWADEERGCLASNRRRSHPTYAIDDLGFRIARSMK